MKTVQLSDVVKYEDSDKWYGEEVSGRLLMSSITFLSFDKEFIKVSKFMKNNNSKKQNKTKKQTDKHDLNNI